MKIADNFIILKIIKIDYNKGKKKKLGGSGVCDRYRCVAVVEAKYFCA